MKRQLLRAVAVGACVITGLVPQAVLAQSCPVDVVRGAVYRDFNANGTRQGEELPLAGVQVQAYSPAGALVSSALTDATGNFNLTASPGTPLRVEFTNPSGYWSGRVGGQSSSSVVFLDGPGRCDLSYGVSDPVDYCPTASNLATTCFVNGDPLKGGSAGELDSAVVFPYGSSGDTVPPIEIARAKQIGTTWGLAYQRSTKWLFAGAFLKRHAGYGPLGTGGIYKIDVTNPAQPVVQPFVDLRALGVDTGTDPRTIPGDPGLPADMTIPSLDPNTFAEVGRQGLGDLEISQDEKTLWAINLKTRALLEIFIDAPARAPTAQDVRSYPVPNPGCSSGDFKVFGLTIQQGRVYVGASCSAESSQSVADLKGKILTFNGGTFSTVFDFPLNYGRGTGVPPGFPAIPSIDAEWRPFPTSFAQFLNGAPLPNPGAFYISPNAVVSSMQFLRDGSLVVLLMDIFGHRGGPFNSAPELLAGNQLSIEHTPPSGQALVVGFKNGQYALESNSQVLSDHPALAGSTLGQGNHEGPGDGERFFGDANPNVFGEGIAAHSALNLGGLFTHPAFVQSVNGVIEDDVIATTYNPRYPAFERESAGIREYSLITGDVDRWYRIYKYDPVTDPGRFGKAAGLGDLELLCPAAPLEIGNRVWLDVNKNGVQDAAEPGIAGVTVRLYNGNNQLVGTTTTAADGTYYFRTESGLTFNSGCSVRLDASADYRSGGPLSGLVLTSANAGGRDTIDSDAVSEDGKARLSCQTGAPGQNDHSYDFGFQAPDCQLTDTTETLIRLDGGGAGLRNLAKQSANRILKRSGEVKCSKNKKQLKQVLAEQEADYNTLWNTVWSIPTVTVSCTQTPLSCSEVNLASYSSTLTTKTSQMRSRLEGLLQDRCLQGKGDKKYVTQTRRAADRIVQESGASLSALGASVRTCSP